jgi:integrase
MSESHPTAPGTPVKPAKPYPEFPLTAHPAGYWCKKIKGKVHYFGRWNDPEGALRAFEAFVAGKPVEKPAPSPSSKPSKPYPDYPLTPHPTGYWCKKIRGKIHYFGPWDDPDGALAKYLEQKDDLHAGRTPRPDPEGVTVKDAANAFLNHKRDKVEAGELSAQTWEKYRQVADLVVKEFGKSRLVADLRPDDFTALKNTMTRSWGPLRVADFIQHVRSVFKHALDAELIDRPVRFGPGFARPSQKTMRLHRANQGPKLFTAGEVRKLLAAAGTPLKAMILLGINCGFGNADVGRLPLTALDLDAGWIDFPRPKTGVGRRCPLWPETVQALREALANRPEPKDPAAGALVFVTKYGAGWAKDTIDNPVHKETAKVLRRLGINGRKGLGFYTLRHVFRTVADEAKDQPAADHIMGHESSHMSSHYRETISDARLKAVADYVRRWLFPDLDKCPVKGENSR